MTKSTTNPITRIVARLTGHQAPPPPAPPPPAPQPEEEDQDPTEKVNYRFISYGD